MVKWVLAPLGTLWVAGRRWRLSAAEWKVLTRLYLHMPVGSRWRIGCFGSLCRMPEGRAVDSKCTVAEAPRIHFACDM